MEIIFCEKAAHGAKKMFKCRISEATGVDAPKTEIASITLFAGRIAQPFCLFLCHLLRGFHAGAGAVFVIFFSALGDPHGIALGFLRFGLRRSQIGNDRVLAKIGPRPVRQLYDVPFRSVPAGFASRNGQRFPVFQRQEGAGPQSAQGNGAEQKHKRTEQDCKLFRHFVFPPFRFIPL